MRLWKVFTDLTRDYSVCKNAIAKFNSNWHTISIQVTNVCATWSTDWNNRKRKLSATIALEACAFAITINWISIVNVFDWRFSFNWHNLGWRRRWKLHAVFIGWSCCAWRRVLVNLNIRNCYNRIDNDTFIIFLLALLLYFLLWVDELWSWKN